MICIVVGHLGLLTPTEIDPLIALAKLQDPDTAAKRFRATDSLLEFLETL